MKPNFWNRDLVSEILKPNTSNMEHLEIAYNSILKSTLLELIILKKGPYTKKTWITQAENYSFQQTSLSKDLLQTAQVHISKLKLQK